MKHEGTKMERRGFLFAAAAALLAGCASQGSSTPGAAGGALQFSDTERKTIENFYGARGGDPSAARVKPGGVLEPGQRPAKLPSDLLARLPDLPSPYTRYVLDTDVILVNRDSHAVLDVITQVVR